jgi:predicted nucleotide-binding protein (sugar kinase/HSP70/actin superfamily)
MVVGQIMDALLSGKYDLNKVAVMITQTGGGCRATNYIGFIRRALEKAGMSQVPVISLSASGLEKNPGLKITPKLLITAMQSLVYGDVFMRVLYRTRPYEAVPGSANALHQKWLNICIDSIKNGGSWSEYKRNLRGIIRDFDNLELDETVKKPRVGVVGEILVKFLPSANNYLVELLEAEGAEAVVPDLLDFLQYCAYNSNFKSRYLGKKKSSARISNLVIWALEKVRGTAKHELAKSKRFAPPVHIKKLAAMAESVVSIGNQTGEGGF